MRKQDEKVAVLVRSVSFPRWFALPAFQSSMARATGHRQHRVGHRAGSTRHTSTPDRPLRGGAEFGGGTTPIKTSDHQGWLH